MPEHETIYKTILHTLPDFFFELDTDSCFAYVNNSSLISGFTPEELSSLHAGIIFHPDDYSLIESYLTSVSDQNNNMNKFSEKIRVRKKSAVKEEYIESILSLYPLYDQRNYRGCIGIIRTPQVLQESTQAMVLAEKHYRALLANSGELILIVTSDGTILFASESALRILGYVPFDLIGEEISSYINSEDTKRFHAAMKKNESEEILLHFRKKNGQTAHMNSRIQIVKDPNGSDVCAIINSQNISGYIRVEKELEKTKSQINDLFNSGTVGLLSIVAESGIIMSSNSYVRQLFNIDKDREYDNFYDLFERKSDRDSFIQEIKTRRHISNYEMTLCGPSAKFFNILVNARISDNDEITILLIDLTGFRSTEKELLHLQKHDPLTSLPNRSCFEEYIQEKLKSGKIFALLCLGIDRFKQINDQYGHAAGDIVIKKLADRIKNVYFSKDLVSRFESDRFMIIISDLGNPKDGIDYDIIELLSRKTKEIFSLPFIVDASEVRLQSSVGICFYPFDGTESEVLINRTELSMFMAKERGGNTFSYYDDRVNTDMLQRYQLEKELFEAHASREFQLYYQPLVNTEGKIIGLEALLRWKNRRGEFVPPSEFIPIAEKNSLIVEIGYFVFERACEDLVEINRIEADIKMNINISPVQFSQYDFIDNIKHILHISTVPVNNLEIEITETALFDNMDIAVEKLHQFEKMGFSISIDDFGTGYSSLAKLKTFPLKAIKIDKSFVDDVTENEASAMLVRTMIDLAHNLGCEVIAEGVETEEQFSFLKKQGCDILQGYYFSKPLPLGELLTLMRKE